MDDDDGGFDVVGADGDDASSSSEPVHCGSDSMSFFTASSSRCCQFDAVVDAILYMLYAVYAVFDSK